MLGCGGTLKNFPGGYAWRISENDDCAGKWRRACLQILEEYAKSTYLDTTLGMLEFGGGVYETQLANLDNIQTGKRTSKNAH